MTRGIPHSDETRAAVLAALMEGQAVTAVAEQFHLHHKTVIEWRDAAGISPTRVEHKMSIDIGELVLRHVRSALLALEAQAGVASDPEWIRAQPASDVAVLYGVMADKAHRILAALEPGPPDDDPTIIDADGPIRALPP